MSRNKIAFVIILTPAFLFLQGCLENTLPPEPVNHLQAPRLLYTPMRTPCKGITTVDYSGKTYHTVEIGRQCWLRENLDVGVRINGNVEQTNNRTIEKYCYNNASANCAIYGGLYQWNEAMQYTTTGGARGICPEGWHIPTRAEFLNLVMSVDSNSNALKTVGQGVPPDGEGTNTSGFSALLAGYRTHYGYFDDLSIGAIFWSSTENSSTYAYLVSLHFGSNRVSLNNYVTTDCGFSIRCIKD